MDTYQLRSNCDFYRKRILDKKLQVERGKLQNEEIDRIRVKLSEVTDTKQDVQLQITSLKNLKEVVTKEADSFRKRRITYLDDQITEAIADIFPEEKFIASIQYDFKYGKSKAYLILRDGAGNERIPFVSEGKLCQYLISFASAVSTVVGLGASQVFVDEAFGVSSEENLPKVGQIINNYSKLGVQFLIIAQNSDLYVDIARREIHFHKETVGSDDRMGKVVLDQIIDY